MPVIKGVNARQVLDSRGNPTIEVEVSCFSATGSAIAPSGASTGRYEAYELRDGHKHYAGKGVLKAVKNVNTTIKKALIGMNVLKQQEIDEAMRELDATRNKKRLGANAILATSMAVARTAAKVRKEPLYTYLADLAGNKQLRMPVPFANIINGGKHAGNSMPFQEFMIAPLKAKNFFEATRMVVETYHHLKSLIRARYGNQAINVGDEGGFAPPISNPDQALLLVQRAIREAGHKSQVRMALDVAASELFRKHYYDLGERYSTYKLLHYYEELIKRFKICSVEDPFDQDDFAGWSLLTKYARIQIVGDDLTVSNPERIDLVAKKKLCNALLLKPNQVGTVTESLQAAKLAKKYKWKVMVAHRSGETEDTFISDLAVGLGCGQIKLGAPCRGERTSKYNRLLRIEEELGRKVKYGWS
jgi:enolase